MRGVSQEKKNRGLQTAFAGGYNGYMQFAITTNAIDAKYFFNRLARTQLPFAISRAINRIAYDVRDDEINPALLGYYFDLRTSWLTKKGAMPVVPSRKSQFPDVHAILGVSSEVAALAATGGERRPGKGGHMAAPLSNAGGGQSARQALNPGVETLGPRFFPSRIVRPAPKRRGKAGKARPFAITSDKGTFIAQRKGGQLQFLYSIVRKAQVKQQWPLVNNVQTHVSRYYSSVLAREMATAVASAR